MVMVTMVMVIVSQDVSSGYEWDCHSLQVHCRKWYNTTQLLRILTSDVRKAKVLKRYHTTAKPRTSMWTSLPVPPKSRSTSDESWSQPSPSNREEYVVKALPAKSLEWLITVCWNLNMCRKYSCPGTGAPEFMNPRPHCLPPAIGGLKLFQDLRSTKTTPSRAVSLQL